MIERYTQGFYKFGPLEQCNDGDLVKYEDHVDEINAKNDYIAFLVDENKSVNNDYWDVVRDNSELNKKYFKLESELLIWKSVVLVFGSVALTTLIASIITKV